MQEISEATLMEALNAGEGVWQEMPFPPDKVPEGHVATSVQGSVEASATFLVVEAKLPSGNVIYDGTCVLLKPFAVIHITPAVAKAAFLKGRAWLEKQKQSPKA